MSEPLTLVLAGVAGVGLGAVFFGGLWWTVRKALSSKWAPLWFSCSLMLRLCVALAGFYAVCAGRWQRLLACLLGFAAARLAVAWLTRTARKPACLRQEA